MLKLILAPDEFRFLLKTNFIYNVMAKTSVTNMSTWGVYCVNRKCSWRYAEDLTSLLGIFLERSFAVVLCIHANSNWMTSLRAGTRTVHRQSLGGGRRGLMVISVLQGCGDKLTLGLK